MNVLIDLGRRRGLALLGSTGLWLGLSGCVSVGQSGGLQVHHRLHDVGPTPQRLPKPLVSALLIQVLPGDALADSHTMAYTRAPQQFAFYQQSQWLERPSRMVASLLTRRLEARGLAAALGRMGEPLQADWLLSLSLEDVHHDFTSPPGLGRLSLRADLLDRRQRQRQAQLRLTLQAAATSADAAGAAQALSLALSQGLDQLLPWLESELRRAGAAS